MSTTKTAQNITFAVQPVKMENASPKEMLAKRAKEIDAVEIYYKPVSMETGKI